MSLFYAPPNSNTIFDISGLLVQKGAKCICFFRNTYRNEIHHIQCETEQECDDTWESFQSFLLKNQEAIR